MKQSKNIFWALAFVLLSAYSMKANACSRVMYKGQNGIVMTARSMDWAGEMPTELWAMPRGFARDGYTGQNSVKWISKYGSVVAVAYSSGATDGMNEKGLMANVLWLKGSKYVDPDSATKPTLSVGVWISYILDNYASVNEAVDGMQRHDFDVVGMKMPPANDYDIDIHISISDATGDNAIFEYINGKLVVYHSTDYVVMTNEPTYDKQLYFAEYWKSIGGFQSLPGTNRPEDRFARASFYTRAIPPTDDATQAAHIAFSIIREVSVPIGIKTENRPNVSTTIWRVVADHKNLLYYFEDTRKFNSTVWLDLKKVDFSLKKGIRRLDMAKSGCGDMSNKIEKMAMPAEFMQ